MSGKWKMGYYLPFQPSLGGPHCQTPKNLAPINDAEETGGSAMEGFAQLLVTLCIESQMAGYRHPSGLGLLPAILGVCSARAEEHSAALILAPCCLRIPSEDPRMAMTPQESLSAGTVGGHPACRGPCSEPSGPPRKEQDRYPFLRVPLSP